MTTSLPIRFVAIERICLLGVLLLIAVWFISTGLSLPPGEVRAPNQDEFEQAGLHFNYFRHYFLPLLVRVALISAGFYQLNFRIMPQLIDGIQQSRNSLLLILIIFGTFVVNLITELYMRQYLFFSANAFASHARVWREAFLLSLGLMLAFVAYTCLKYTGVYLLKHTIRSLRTKKILGRELTIALSIWALVGVLLGFSRAEELFMLWLLAAPSAYAFYLFAARWAIPKAMQVRRKKVYYFLVSSVFCLLLFFAGALLFALIFDDEDAAAGAAASSAFVQLLIAAPASWVIYKRQMKGRDELVALKKELGASTANLDFLRSQINPHFLFNALNTIYGTAIQEGAERTG